jgi:hypothetical protein
MIFEVTFWIAFILLSRAIAKIYYRRRDVLYGPYRATTRCRRSKADEWSRQKFNRWDAAHARRDLSMDEEFLKQRVRLTRDLAEQADPFIKRRLMDLANNYEARLTRPSQATVSVLSISVETPSAPTLLFAPSPAKPDS